MTLLEGLPGSEYIVESVDVNEKVGRRLEALGLIQGTKLEVLNDEFSIQNQRNPIEFIKWVMDKEKLKKNDKASKDPIEEFLTN